MTHHLTTENAGLVQLGLPLEVPDAERNYHALVPWRDSPMCKVCGLMLMNPIHGLSTAELAAIQARKVQS